MGKRIRLVCDWCGVTADEFEEPDMCCGPIGSRMKTPPSMAEINAMTPADLFAMMPASPYPKGWIVLTLRPLDTMTSMVGHDHQDVCAACAASFEAFRDGRRESKPLADVTPIRGGLQ